MLHTHHKLGDRVGPDDASHGRRVALHRLHPRVTLPHAHAPAVGYLELVIKLIILLIND